MLYQEQFKSLRHLRMIPILRGASVLMSVVMLLALAPVCRAQGSAVPDNIESIDVPPIPSSLPGQLAPYSSVYGLPLAGWDMEKHEILLKGISNSTWISRVNGPAAKPFPTGIYIRSSGIYDVYFQPQEKYLAYTRDAGGNESFSSTCTTLLAGQA
jgi:hypothetical protein